MASLHFTKNLQRHVTAESAEVAGATVREVLQAFFVDNPQVRGYVLDDQGALRKHMVIFINGEQIVDRLGLSDAVDANAELYVMQALSGG